MSDKRVCIKSMCCNQFGEGDSMHKIIDDLKLENEKLKVATRFLGRLNRTSEFKQFLIDNQEVIRRIKSE